jgi:hypothetical protein
MVDFDNDTDCFLFRIYKPVNDADEIRRCNFFVRLHPKAVQDVYLLATQKLLSSPCLPELVAGETGWILGRDKPSENCSSGIEFLPLAISVLPITTEEESGENVHNSYYGRDFETFYTSYNGGDLLIDCKCT